MQAWSWVQHHRWLSVVFLAIVIVGMAGGACWAVFFRTVASPVSLRDALRLYRHDEAAAAAPAGGGVGVSGTVGASGTAGANGAQVSGTGAASDADPAGSAGAVSGSTDASQPLSNGVFQYRTAGSESLSIPGQARSFPDNTDMVVSDTVGGCSAVDWVPLIQHTETTTVCPSANHSMTVSDFITHEQISGTTTNTVIDCPAATYLVPPGATAGVRWTATCHQTSPSEDVVLHGLVVGASPIDVGGQSVATVHVRLTLQFAGVDDGTDPTDLWISTAKGLVVREQEQATVTQEGIHYKEEMSTLLASLTPAD